MARTEPTAANLPPKTAEFLHGTRDPATFRHADHLRAGFDILARHSFLEAAMAYSAALKALAARAGKSGLYHETVTLAFLSVIAERMAHANYADSDAFIAANPDLLSKAVLERWYGHERLGSALARATFLLPDARTKP